MTIWMINLAAAILFIPYAAVLYKVLKKPKV